MIKNNIGRELKKAEKSQAWLATFTGISTGMVSQLVSGRSIPTAPELALICAAFLCRPEALYAPDMVSLIKGTEKPEQGGAKSYRGKHVLLTDGLADAVDEYGKRYGMTRNESARTLIILGLREESWMKKIEYEQGGWYGETERENDDNPDVAAPSDV